MLVYLHESFLCSMRSDIVDIDIVVISLCREPFNKRPVCQISYAGRHETACTSVHLRVQISEIS